SHCWHKMSHLTELFKYVDDHQDLYVQVRLLRKNIIEIPLPPIILGQLGSDPAKKTVCIYGHLDVQPANIDDGWDTEPFTLVEKDGKLYGRGSTDDKGPVLAWFNCIEAYQKIGKDLPINIKFCFEGMEESGSEGLDDLVFSRKDTFFKDVDYVCISDNYWLGKNKPCITYGLRGICYFFIEVKSCWIIDLHSGVFGGSVHEAMTDLIALMGSSLNLTRFCYLDTKSKSVLCLLYYKSVKHFLLL
uniref:Cytosolic non-specific dipeptidase n=1 Tax=Pundamilia nyererei TaxID=303518 RepID=A0A3B4FPZ2_9CICH